MPGKYILFGKRNFDIWRKANAVNLAFIRGEPAGNRDSHGAAVLCQRDPVLYGTLTVSGFSNQLAAPQVLDGPGRNFGSRGGPLIH